MYIYSSYSQHLHYNTLCNIRTLEIICNKLNHQHCCMGNQNGETQCHVVDHNVMKVCMVALMGNQTSSRFISFESDSMCPEPE